MNSKLQVVETKREVEAEARIEPPKLLSFAPVFIWLFFSGIGREYNQPRYAVTNVAISVMAIFLCYLFCPPSSAPNVDLLIQLNLGYSISVYHPYLLFFLKTNILQFVETLR